MNQGIPDNFDPEVCDCEELARIVLATLERCEVYLQEAGPNHPLNIRLGTLNGEPGVGWQFAIVSMK